MACQVDALAEQDRLAWDEDFERRIKDRTELIKSRHLALKSKAPQNGTVKKPKLKLVGAPPSASEILLEAARGLKQPFSLSRLVLACWQANQEIFGLPGYEKDHPSEARVRNALYGPRGPLRSGEIVKEGDNYCVKAVVSSISN